MHEKWKHIDGRDDEYPEAFVLNDDGNKIKVEVNREKKQLRITAETDGGEVIESSITNGVVLEERNIRTGAKENLGDQFKTLERYLSAIPDTKIIRLIGGNYGVFGDFLRTAGHISGEDVLLLKQLGRFFLDIPRRILTGFLSMLRAIGDRPSLSDVVDCMLVLGGSYLAYLVNFDYAFGGLVLMIGAVLSGYVDWLVRRRDPYVLKVIILIIPAFYIVTLGLRYQ